MFQRNDYFIFITSLLLILVGYVLMAVDPVANGFGIMTLWIAPPVLLIGFGLPVAGIIGINSLVKLRLALKTAKHAFGFLVVVISLVTYMLTLEPTASLWDCSEFIASAYKLQVPHTPGTPLSLLVGRIFTMLAGTDVKQVAWTLNAMSGIFSALTAYLLYHLIYYFGRRLYRNTAGGRNIPLIAASLCGSLTLTFSDTFWFSAVEAETYGVACFFLLLLVALILKGSGVEEPQRSRWLVLIFYVGGLSYCIHPMCVLALPLLPFSWYTKNRSLSIWNTAIPLLCGLIMVLAINRVIGVGSFELAFAFDRYFVNNLGLPFYSGAIGLAMVILLLCVFLFRKFPGAKRYTWSYIFLLLGFMPYLMLFIRSNHNPPIDETNPEDLAMIKAYMNRESYGSSPLLFGPYYDAQIESVTIKKNIYHKTNDDYSFSGTMPEYQYQNGRSTILPRLYSNDADHVESYRMWTGLRENEKPDFGDNLYFMFTYQLGHMYMRYLMFNFAGRESDHQNDSWLTPWSSLQTSEPLEFSNKARNQYWMLPLILGIIGLFWQWKKDSKGFIIVALFFLITGLVLALYLNSPPIEPRERDYIYIGSFIAFCIWVGLGLIPLSNVIQKMKLPAASAFVVAAGIPLLMLWQNHDDHDRSGRTYQVDNARNVLNSCAPNAIMFTGGDNDTFPLWYLQEVEGYRTDVRVMVLSYMNTDWYINQLRKGYYQSQPFLLSLAEKDYMQYGPNDVLYLQESIKEGIDVRKYIQLLKDDNSALRAQSSSGDLYTILPSRLLKVKIDKATMERENSLAVNVSSQRSPEEVPAEFTVRVNGNYLQKNGLAMLDLIASNGWTRPVYFNYTSLNTAGLALESHVIQEGNVYRLSPIVHSDDDIAVDKELMHKNLIELADYSNLADKHINFGFEDFHSRMIIPVRQSFNTLAVAYLRDGDIQGAEEILQYALDNLYLPHLLPSYTSLQAADLFLSLNRNDAAIRLCKSLFDYHCARLQSTQSMGHAIERVDLYLSRQSAQMLTKLGQPEYAEKLKILGFAEK